VQTEESSSLHMETPCCEVGRATFQDYHSTFTGNNSVRHTTRRGAAEIEVPKHEEKLTCAWRQIGTLRRRYKGWYKGDNTEDCARKRRYETSYHSMVKVLQQNTWIDDREFLVSCVRARLGQSKTISITLHMTHGRQTSSQMACKN